VGRITKRAQIPFSSWLPAAISAPTPVSSLVHSSTLVTAGVYLILRFYLILNKAVIYFLITVSIITIILRRLSGVTELDLKKIVAFSTLSQLGFIILIITLGSRLAAFFHLVIHAFFKSLIFLCAGIFIHSFNSQRLKSIGRMSNFNLIRTILISSIFSIRGVIFLSGFFSKDLIIEIVFNSKTNLFMYGLTLISISLTILYRARIIFKTLITYPLKNFIILSRNFILGPVIILRIMSTFIGNFFM